MIIEKKKLYNHTMKMTTVGSISHMEINICNQETFVDFDKHQEYNVHSTKRCPECKNDKLLLLTSQNLKLCGNTGMHKDGKIKRIPWNLDEGQKPIF